MPGFRARDALLAALFAFGASAHAVTYQVGPGRAYSQLAEVAKLVNPGDVVEIEPGGSYGSVHWTRSGTLDAPITIRGTAQGAQRPVIDAAGAADAFRMDVSHYVVEDVVISNATRACMFLKGTRITLRRVAVHTCRSHGILGADEGTGEILLTEVEVRNTGNPAKPSDSHHPIYIATDHLAHPRAELRIEKSWIHDNHSGNGIKSRARNGRFFYNWIEITNRATHTIEAIGPDPEWAPKGGLCPVPDGRNDAELCNAEIIGNVLISRGERPFMMRLGSDATGHSYGRYRIVNNTFVAGPAFESSSAAMIRAFGPIQSIELHNNLFWIEKGDVKAFRIVRDVEAKWTSGRRVAGKRNLVTGKESAYRDGVPAADIQGLDQTIFAPTTPIFMKANLASPDLRLHPLSPALYAGNVGSTSTPGFQLRNATNLPTMQPSPTRPVQGAVTVTPRGGTPGVISVGAIEASR